MSHTPFRRRTLVLAVLLAGLIAHAPPARAQSIGRHFANIGGDVWAVWISPFRSQPRDWLLFAAGVGAAAAVTPLDDNVDRWAVKHANDGVFNVLSPFREGGDAFSGRTVGPLAAGVLAISLVTGNQNMQDGVFGCIAAYAANYGIRHYVSYPLVARTRPDTRGDVPAPPAREGDQYRFTVPGSTKWEEHSIPGGHVANITTCASFLTRRFEMGVFEPLPWLFVGGVGVSRILDRRHWVSDQMIGGLLGYAVGKEVALRSLRRRQRAAEEAGGASLRLMPGDAVDGIRIGVTRRF